MSLACPVRASAEATPAAPALAFGGRVWSYAELDAGVGRWVAALTRRGVRPKDSVVLVSHNCPAVVFAFFALGRLGARLAPLNARLTPAELAPLAAALDARLLLAQAALASRLPGAEELERLGSEARRLLPAEGPASLEAHAGRLVLFSSGTTGRPKGALLTEGNLRAAALASAAHLGPSPAPRWLGTLPLFHVGGLAMLWRCAHAGGLLVLHERLEAAAVSSALDAQGITHASFVSTSLERVLEARGGRPVPATFRVALVGGGPVGPPLLERARAAGLQPLQTYGLTEATSQVCTERPGEADGTSAGPPLPGLAVRIVGEGGEPLEAGAEGDIEVQGPTVMSGYVGDPGATREALRDGWLRTRDVGLLDARGRLHVLARRTDLILSGGENVYPAEVEAVLAAHPLVAEAAVVGVADARWGQVPVALVVPGAAGLATDALDAWCRERLAGFKLPRRYVTAAVLPRNAMGKIDRAAVRRLVEG